MLAVIAFDNPVTFTFNLLISESMHAEGLAIFIYRCWCRLLKPFSFYSMKRQTDTQTKSRTQLHD